MTLGLLRRRRGAASQSARRHPRKDAVQRALRRAGFARSRPAAIGAVTTEAEKHGWAPNVAVDDSGANLVAFARMDGAQLASIAISEHKAHASVKFLARPKHSKRGFRKMITNINCRWTTSSPRVAAFR
jgi:Haem-degrading